MAVDSPRDVGRLYEGRLGGLGAESGDSIKIFFWILGFAVGLFVPAVVAIIVGLNFMGNSTLGNSRMGFFGCLAASLLLVTAGIAGWRRGAFLRGLAFGAGAWLLVLPAIAGDCTKSS